TKACGSASKSDPSHVCYFNSLERLSASRPHADSHHVPVQPDQQRPSSPQRIVIGLPVRRAVAGRIRLTHERPIKARMGPIHLLTKWPKNVRTEMALNMLTYNIRRAIALIGTRRLTEAIRTRQQPPACPHHRQGSWNAVIYQRSSGWPISQ